MSAAALKYVPDIPVVPPGEDELPYDFGPPMESELHVDQMHLLLELVRRYFADRPDVYVGANMAIYYSELQVKKNDFRGPDFFVVLNTTRRTRKSWVVWQEERTPDLVIELLSESTEAVDRREKMRIYAQAMHVSEYYLFDPLDGRFEAYHLDVPSLTYTRVAPDADGWIWSAVLGLRLGVWHGRHYQKENAWLRLALPDGTLVPTGEELGLAGLARAEEEARRADEEARRAERVEAERDRLMALLRAAGIDPGAAGQGGSGSAG